MNIATIIAQADAEILRLMAKENGVAGFQFGVIDLPSKIFDTKQPSPKVTVWYNLTTNDIQRAYKGLCEKRTLNFIENLQGQYLYIKELF